MGARRVCVWGLGASGEAMAYGEGWGPLCSCQARLGTLGGCPAVEAAAGCPRAPALWPCWPALTPKAPPQPGLVPTWALESVSSGAFYLPANLPASSFTGKVAGSRVFWGSFKPAGGEPPEPTLVEPSARSPT